MEVSCGMWVNSVLTDTSVVVFRATSDVNAWVIPPPCLLMKISLNGNVYMDASRTDSEGQRFRQCGWSRIGHRGKVRPVAVHPLKKLSGYCKTEMKPFAPKLARKRISKRPTVHDVARLAGVSVATVSRALSNPGIVAPNTVAAVRDAVEKLNYVIQGVGRALVSRRTYTVGGLVPSGEPAMFAQTTSALQALLSQHGYTLALGCSDFDPAM